MTKLFRLNSKFFLLQRIVYIQYFGDNLRNWGILLSQSKYNTFYYLDVILNIAHREKLKVGTVQPSILGILLLSCVPCNLPARRPHFPERAKFLNRRIVVMSIYEKLNDS